MQDRESHSESHWAIWIGTGIIAFGIGIYGISTETDVSLLFVLAMVLAFVASVAAWVIPAIIARRTAPLPAEKAKRGGDDKLSLLLALMDEDERVAFKEALKQRMLTEAAPSDGELPYDAETLEALLHEPEARARSGRRLSS